MLIVEIMTRRQDTRGAIWVSAVLFMAVSIIVLSILLTATLPLVEKLKARNVVTETKVLLATMDDNIRTVAREGPGSQRELPFTINEGELSIQENSVTWVMPVKDKLIEPGYIIPEGRLTLFLTETPVKGTYIMNMTTTYESFAEIKLLSQYQNPFVGTYTAVIRNTGNYTNDGLPQITFLVI